MKKEIHWKSWGEESLTQAVSENKPIFISILNEDSSLTEAMKEKTFQNESVIELLNERFIAIKVNPKQRPDIEKFYHKVYHLMNRRSSSLPLSIFTTADLKPFYAGSYISLEAQESELGFEELLRVVSKKYITDHETLVKKGEEVLEFVNPKNQNIEATKLSLNISPTIMAHAENLFDKKYGGFGKKSKFHNTTTLELLFDVYELEKNESLLTLLIHTLDFMSKSELYDQENGGFYHYSKNRDWSNPHKTKMIEENSQLSQLYLRAYYITQNSEYKKIALELIEFLCKKSDKTLFTSQLAIYISSLFKISELETRYQNLAIEALNTLLNTHYTHGQLFHDSKNTIGAFLSDYAYLSQTLLDAYQSTLDENYLITLTKLVNTSIEQFYEYGQWKYTNGFLEIKENTYDIDNTSSLSVMSSVLMSISSLIDSNYKKFVFKTLEFNSYSLMRQPLSSPKLSQMVIRYLKDDIIIKANESLLKKHMQKRHTLGYPFILFKSTMEESFEISNSHSTLAKEYSFENLKSIIKSNL